MNQKIHAATERCEVTQAYLKERGAPETIGSGDTSVYIIGDSYTAGDVLEDRADAWVNHLPEEWSTTIDGIGGTGFTTPGNCEGNEYSARISAAVEADPDILIIQGGLNDWKANTEDLEAAAYNALQAASEVEQVIMVGPPAAPARANGAAEVDAALRAVTETAGREYISTLDRDLPFGGDELHLTPEGHILFANYLAAESAA